MKHILHVFATFGVGGPQVRFCDRIQTLGSLYKHTIIAMDNRFDCQERLPARDVHFELNPIDYSGKSLFGRVLYFRRLLRDYKPDLLATYNWGTIEWLIANSIMPICPTLHGEYGFRPDEQNKQKLRRIWIRLLLLKTVNCLVVPSLKLKTIASDIWKVPESKIKYIPNGVDLYRFKPMNGEGQNNNQNEIVIGTITGLRKEKNIKKMLDLFKDCLRFYTDLKLRIVGDGIEKLPLMDYANELGLSNSVEFYGRTEKPEELLNTFDIFAITSDTEQMPNALLEAMASALPVISTDVGDIYHMVSDLNREFVFPIGKDQAMIKGALKLIGNPDLRKNVGRCNKKHCHKFYSRELSNSEYKKIYENTINKKDK